jgi:hypothetical protein
MQERLGLSLFRINWPAPFELLPDLIIDNSGLSPSFVPWLEPQILRETFLAACNQKQNGRPEGHFGLLTRTIERARGGTVFSHCASGRRCLGSRISQSDAKLQTDAQCNCHCMKSLFV